MCKHFHLRGLPDCFNLLSVLVQLKYVFVWNLSSSWRSHIGSLCAKEEWKMLVPDVTNAFATRTHLAVDFMNTDCQTHHGSTCCQISTTSFFDKPAHSFFTEPSPCSTLVSASDCRLEGLGFESRQSHGWLLPRAGSAMGPMGRPEPFS